MPLYEYQCSKCGEKFEVLQKFSDTPLTRHSGGCRGSVHRLVSSPALHFKGSGWYVTDYASKGSGKSEGSSEGKTESKSSESTSSESKSPESKSSESKSSDSKASETKPGAKESKKESKPAKTP